jgi:hypothetical protein
MSDIFKLLAAKQVNGFLELHSGSKQVTVLLRSGQATGEATATIAHAAGHFRWLERVEETLSAMLDSGSGRFEFRPSPPLADDAEPIALRVLLRRAQARAARREQARSVFPTDFATVRATHPTTTSTVTLSAPQWRLLANLDRPCRAPRLATRLGMDLADLAELVQPLVEAGVVEVEDPRDGRSAIQVPIDPNHPGRLSFPRPQVLTPALRGDAAPAEPAPVTGPEPDREGFLSALARSANRRRDGHTRPGGCDASPPRVAGAPSCADATAGAPRSRPRSLP